MSASVMQQFDIFAQLVASGNIVASARSLGLSPVRIVEAMNSLEDRLGFRIFAMANGSVELTDTGRKLVAALGSMEIAAQEKWIDDSFPLPADPDKMTRAPVRQPPPPTESPQLRDIPPSPEPVPTGSHGPGWHASSPFAGSASPTAERSKAQNAENKAKATPRPSPPAEQNPAIPASPPSPPAQDAVRQVVLASHPAIFSHFQEALVAFEEASPDIGITMRLAGIGAPEVADLFARNLADIAYFYALEEPERFLSRYAWSERISLFVGEGHPLAGKDGITAADLADTPYVALAPGNLARALIEEALAGNGLHVGPALMETDNLYEIMKQVQSRPCYFAAFGPMARDFGKMSGIVRLPWAQGLPQIQVRQAVRDDLANDPAIVALAEFLFR